MDYDSLSAGLDALLAKPVGAHRSTAVSSLTKEVTRTGDSLEVTLPETVMEANAAAVLTAEGLDPDQWEVTGFRKSEWGPGKTSTRFNFKRRSSTTNALRAPLTDAELALLADARPKTAGVPESTTELPTAVILVADTQLGKLESDPGTVMEQTFRHIDQALEDISKLDQAFHVVVAFMGDHIEGFVSQGGANAWRTPMPLTEQIRLTRRMMIHALTRAVSYGFDVSMVAVPSNHGQAVRFGNKAPTTYDDDHCTEALIAVKDGVDLVVPGTSSMYAGVKFFVPETDELAVSLELSGTHTVFAHGHMAKPGRYTDYVKGQAFNRGSVYHNADVVCFGHFHEFRVEMSSDRMIIVAPAGEEESTWYRHSAGAGGYPAIVWFMTQGGGVTDLHLIH